MSKKQEEEILQKEKEKSEVSQKAKHKRKTTGFSSSLNFRKVGHKRAAYVIRYCKMLSKNLDGVTRKLATGCASLEHIFVVMMPKL